MEVESQNLPDNGVVNATEGVEDDPIIGYGECPLVAMNTTTPRM